MKIQYLGFLPLIIIFTWSFIETYKNRNDGSHFDPTLYRILFVASFLIITIGGLMWAIGA